MHSARLFVFGAVSAAIAIACGGRVDATPSNDGKIPTSPAPPPTFEPPTLNPPVPSSDLASRLGAQVAKSYCAILDKCCRSTGLTPIDFASCVSYTESRVTAHALVYARAQTVSDAEIAACTTAIETRLARCSPTDAKWWGPGDSTLTTSLFVPASVAKPCGVFLDLPARPVSKACGDGTACENGETCAVDECVAATEKGAACAASAGCLDGEDCIGSVCASAPRGQGACTEDAQCALGLVCGGTCIPANRASTPYRERHSPYRVAPETCQIFVKL